MFWLAFIALILAALLGKDALRRLWRLTSARIWAAVVAGCVAAQLSWIVLADGLDLSVPIGFEPTLSNTDLARETVGRAGGFYLEMLGNLGWLDTTLPGLTYLLLTAALGALVLLAVAVGIRPYVIAMLAAMAITVVIPIVLEAWQYRGYGLYWQGRYTLPIAVGVPLLAVVAAAVRDRPARSPARVVRSRDRRHARRGARAGVLSGASAVVGGRERSGVLLAPPRLDVDRSAIPADRGVQRRVRGLRGVAARWSFARRVRAGVADRPARRRLTDQPTLHVDETTGAAVEHPDRGAIRSERTFTSRTRTTGDPDASMATRPSLVRDPGARGRGGHVVAVGDDIDRAELRGVTGSRRTGRRRHVRTTTASAPAANARRSGGSSICVSAATSRVTGSRRTTRAAAGRPSGPGRPPP